ncbi:MAG: alpha/beta hydrolase [Negativicutes bacterium]|nr:alpha/beta hydrolase [Negativicutes bacterium]
MNRTYLDRELDPELKSIIARPPAYLGIWSNEGISEDKIFRKIGRDIIYPLIPTPPDPEVKVTEKVIPGPKGAPDMSIRIYEPKERKGMLPGVLYFHCGGYSLGSPAHEDASCYKYVKEVNCVIVSPNYRLAPENPAPAAYEDCYQALLWVAEQANEIGIDCSRLAVTGLSCGGGLAIAVAMMARDRKGPLLTFQMPIAPTIDDRLNTKSSLEFTDPRALNYKTCRKIWDLYLGEGHENRDDISPYAAPSRATDLSGLPPCYSYVGALDPHRDETIAYINKLLQAGVSAGFSLYPQCIHAFELENPEAEISKQAVAMAILFLKKALYK